LGSFNEHISQANNNLEFLSQINNSSNPHWDWHVTTCFYIALHLMNAHIVEKTKGNYLSHSQVGQVLNPYSRLSTAKLDEDTYKSYNKLMQLSRRSRYLLNEGIRNEGQTDIQKACITYDKHFCKAIYHLDVVMQYLSKNYAVTFKSRSLTCIELKGRKFDHFTVN